MTSIDENTQHRGGETSRTTRREANITMVKKNIAEENDNEVRHIIILGIKLQDEPDTKDERKRTVKKKNTDEEENNEMRFMSTTKLSR